MEFFKHVSQKEKPAHHLSLPFSRSAARFLSFQSASYIKTGETCPRFRKKHFLTSKECVQAQWRKREQEGGNCCLPIHFLKWCKREQEGGNCCLPTHFLKLASFVWSSVNLPTALAARTDCTANLRFWSRPRRGTRWWTKASTRSCSRYRSMPVGTTARDRAGSR